ncbi:MAG: hypothetical protein NT049_09140 [Planctomycetota bacterium]|nr:hypothetical protein [Planctomycetota bacterium]
MGVHPVHAALSTDYVQKLVRIKARQVVHKHGFSRSDQPDVEQELVAHVLGAAHLFDPGRASVNTFIARVVDSTVAMILRNRGRKKRVADRPMWSLDRDQAGRRGHEPVLLREIVEEADLRRRQGMDATVPEETQALDAADLLARLAPELREIVVKVAETNEAAAARDLGISRRQVRKALAAVREQFRGAEPAEF